MRGQTKYLSERISNTPDASAPNDETRKRILANQEPCTKDKGAQPSHQDLEVCYELADIGDQEEHSHSNQAQAAEHESGFHVLARLVVVEGYVDWRGDRLNDAKHQSDHEIQDQEDPEDQEALIA